MNPKILIVDDQKSNLEQMVEYMKHQKFVDIYTASSLEEAIKKASSEHFDVIISDMILETEEAGFDIVKTYKNFSPLVIIITAYPSIELMKKCFREGVYDYIDKNKEDAYEQMAKTVRAGLSELKEKNRKIDINALFIQNHFDELIKKYNGKYIAVLDEKVVGNNKDYEALKNQIKEKFPFVSVSIVAIPKNEVKIG